MAEPAPSPIPWISQKGRPPAGKSASEVRECRRHGAAEFHRYRAGQGTYRWRCKRCVGERVTRRHQKLRRMLVDEAGGACALCGYARCITNLHFHHVDPSTKAFGMSMARGKSIAAYRAEAVKCVLVCANCHGEIETGLIPSPPPQARWPRVTDADPRVVTVARLRAQA